MKKLAVVPEEAEIVKLIFKLDEQGEGVRAIATKLNNQGILTRKGDKWSPWTIRNMLDQPLYRGTVDVAFGRRELAHEWLPVGQQVTATTAAPPILAKAPKAS